LRRRRLRLLGHVYRMNDNRILKQALKWSPVDGKRKERTTDEELENDCYRGPEDNGYGLG